LTSFSTKKQTKTKYVESFLAACLDPSSILGVSTIKKPN
jgi:hypothetical protein